MQNMRIHFSFYNININNTVTTVQTIRLILYSNSTQSSKMIKSIATKRSSLIKLSKVNFSRRVIDS